MSHASALLPDTLRYRLKLDPELGAGNFLHRACLVNSALDSPLIYSDQPITVFGTVRPSALSIGQIEEIANQYAAWFLNRGISPMDPVAVYCDQPLHYLIQYVALTAIGAIPVLTNPTLPGTTATQYFHRVKTVGIITDQKHQAFLAPYINGSEFKCLDCVEDIPASDHLELPLWYPFAHDFDDPVMITHTSGTTGVPKAVVLQHGKWFHGIRYLLGLKAAQGVDRYLSSIPASHNASIAYCMHAILTGAELMVMGDRSGEAVARMIEHFRPSTVVSFPQTYVELTELSLDSFDFGSVTVWINTGDAAHEAHIRKLVAHGYHYRGNERVLGSQFVDGLGSSEMGHASFRVIHTPYTDNYDRCVGLPQEWVQAAVLDADGNSVPDGVVGHLGIRSASITEGYWNDSLLTFKSRLRGYWLTGDLVYRDHLGCYYHLDRAVDVIQTQTGPLYSLQTEEFILKYEPTLIDCTVIGVRERENGIQTPLVLAIPRTGSTVDPAVLLREINQRQSASGRPLVGHVLMVDRKDIPRGVTDKVLKRSLPEQFLHEPQLMSS